MIFQGEFDNKELISGFISYAWTMAPIIKKVVLGIRPEVSVAGSVIEKTVTLGLDVWKSYKGTPPSINNDELKTYTKYICEAWNETWPETMKAQK